jgi:hypothetical protein
MHAGEGLLIRVTAGHPGGAPVTSGTVTAEFWSPGRDPERDPAARESPDHAVPCEYDERSRRWLARVDSTAGWAPGTWTVRGRAVAASSAEGWAWQTFGLAA